MRRVAGLRSRVIPALMFTALAGLSACSEPTTAPRVSNIVMVTSQSTMRVGNTSQFVVNVIGASGNTLNGVRVDWSTSEPSVATVSASGVVTAVAAGTAIITASAGDVTRDATVLVVPPVCATPAGAPLSVGEVRNSNMSANPCELDGAFTAVGYPLTISAAGGVRLTVTPTGFPAGIAISSATGELLGYRLPQIGGISLRTVLEAGSYRVWVISDVSPSAAQTFTLSSTTAGGRCDNVAVTRSLDLGNTSAAAVSDASCILIGGPAAEGFRLQLPSATLVRATAASAAFAPTVAITTTDQQELLSFSIGTAPGTAATTVALPAGEYLVWGGSFDFATGTVQVGVEEAQPCTPSGALTLGGSVNGALAATDCQAFHTSSAYADVWTFTLNAPTTVRFDLSSASFDAWLELRSSSDSLITYDDDAGGNLNSRIVTTLPAGTYRVWASSFGGAATGAYVLAAASAAPAQARGAGDAAAAVSSPSAKPGRPTPWPAPRSDGTRRTRVSSPPSGSR